jgi:hypothetical protein
MFLKKEEKVRIVKKNNIALNNKPIGRIKCLAQDDAS